MSLLKISKKAPDEPCAHEVRWPDFPVNTIFKISLFQDGDAREHPSLQEIQIAEMKPNQAPAEKVASQIKADVLATFELVDHLRSIGIDAALEAIMIAFLHADTLLYAAPKQVEAA